jgi:hypothetical protein
MRALLAAAAVVLAACNPPVPPNGPTPDQDRVTGRVAVVGSAPMNVRVTVVPDEGPPFYVVGPLESEIRRLSGAHVAVTGRRDGGEIHATDYDVVSVDGRAVMMGTVERSADGSVHLRLKDGATARLTGATAELPSGAKVWVQGPGTVQVQTYGVIRP